MSIFFTGEIGINHNGDLNMAKDLIKVAEETGERQNLPLYITATVPTISHEPVATFILTLSIKKK